MYDFCTEIGRTRARFTLVTENGRELYRLWFSVSGAAAGNLALHDVLMQGGAYIGGGIFARVRELALRFRREIVDAFLAKSPMSSLIGRVPRRLVTRPDAAPVGAIEISRRMTWSAGLAD